ncbi:alpha/beta fold hydrolase [Kutzneria sp. 744]|uniref:alpha/beta fold hydrolase n=1 Tax=Kutzneria sp. (strain 744) TaxID=345341 RepID=UPI0003EEDA05|nr:alpha/beta hydrolase [Kutzneria sp. 744]EWM10996.1 carboxylesterase [Kutzneria sp. 744]
MGKIGGFTDSASAKQYRQIYARVRAQWPAGAEDHDVQTRFGRTHVIRYGQGPPILLVPGTGATAENWSPNAEALGARHTVIAVDTLGLPGLGAQTAPIRRPVDLALWLEDVLDQLGIDTAHVGGLSYGAWASMQLAWHEPRRVESLLLLEPGGNSLGRPPLPSLPRFLRLLALRTEAEFERFGRFVEGGWPNDPDRQRVVNFGMAHYRPSVPMIRYAKDAQVRRLHMPTLVLLGENSIVHDPRQVLDRVRSLMPEVEADIIDGAPHPLAETHAGTVNDRILAFLTSHE